MTKNEMIADLATRPGVPSRAAALAVINALGALVTERLIAGQPTRVHKLATFEPVIAPPHTARHPRTGEQIEVGERVHIKARVSDALKESVRAATGAAA